MSSKWWDRVALRLGLPAQQAPERVAVSQAHERFRRSCAALGGPSLACFRMHAKQDN